MDRGWLLSGVLFASGVGVVRALTYRPKLSTASRVLLIGDEFANGMGPHFRALSLETGVPFMGGAVNNTRVDQWAQSAWLQEKLESFAPSHVLVVLGANDAYTDRPVEAIADDTLALVETIRANNAHPMWVGVPPLPPTHNDEPLDLSITHAIRAEAPYYFDSDLDIPRGPDGLHPTAAGYAGWAGMVWGWLS